MQFGLVTGRFLSADGDPLSGVVRFTPEASAVLVGGTDPATVLPAYVDGVLDSAGYLCDPDNLTDGALNTGATRGLSLVIPETGVTNPPSWTYEVSPQLRDGKQYVTYRSWSIDVTAAGADLATAAAVPSSTGEGITRGMSAYEVWLSQGNTGTVDDYLASLAAGGVDLSTYVTDTELANALSAKQDASSLGSDVVADPTVSASFVHTDAVVYSALDHGLMADWSSADTPGTNNRPALQALVNELSASYLADGRPRHIYCPPGDYSVRDGGVVWATGVSLIGAGPGLTRFHLANPVSTTNPTPLAAYTADFHGASPSAPLVDCTFADLEVDGADVTLSEYSTGAKAFVLQYMIRGRFSNLYLHDTGATALGCDYLQDTIIDRVVAVGNGRLNDGTQPGGAGIGIGIGGWGDVERTTIVNCIARGNGAHGIFVELQDGAMTPPRGLRIIGCHAEGNTHGISDWGADGLIVSGCTMIGNKREGFNVSGDGVAGVAGRGGLVSDSVIDSNTLDGVLIGDTPGVYSLQGNRISRNGGHGVHLASTIHTAGYAVREFVTTGNDIYGNGHCGFRADCVMTDGFITDNRVRNNGSDTTVTADMRSGLTLNAPANSPTIQGNRVWDNQPVATQQYGVYVTGSGTAGSAAVQNNILNGNAAGGIYTAGDISGGLWTQNAGMYPGVTVNAQTTIIDGNEYINGQLRYMAKTRVWKSDVLTPSATASVAGGSQTLSPTSGQLGFSALGMVRVVFGGSFTAETVTATIAATFSDGATSIATVATGSSGTQVLASGGLLALHRDGAYIKKLSASLASSVSGSAVTATVDVIATQN